MNDNFFEKFYAQTAKDLLESDAKHELFKYVSSLSISIEDTTELLTLISKLLVEAIQVTTKRLVESLEEMK